MQKQENNRRNEKISYVRGRVLSAEDAGGPEAAGSSSAAAWILAGGNTGSFLAAPGVPTIKNNREDCEAKQAAPSDSPSDRTCYTFKQCVT